MKLIKVLLIDDHPIVRYGFRQLLAVAPNIAVCSEASDARAAVEQLASRPDVAIVDISLGATNGIDLIRDLKRLAPNIVVLVISMHDELLYAERALRAGASGYVMKHEATESIVKAIRTVANGGIFVSDAVSTRVLQRVTGQATPPTVLDALTNRELHVLQLVGRGLGTRAIAEQLHISVKTVESYRARLKEKMNLRTGTELIRFAVRWAEENER
ncbi:MAG: response regulator transcription factor [Kofleriaceae bacterium]|nr:response regulator transcription factor [Kofleriaceae bacterium]